MKTIEALNEELCEARTNAKNELNSLIEQCYKELRCLDLGDKRMLIATADLKYHFDQVEEKAQELEVAWNELEYAEMSAVEDDTEDNMHTLGLEPRGRQQ
jgi:hypothetical protein